MAAEKEGEPSKVNQRTQEVHFRRPVSSSKLCLYHPSDTFQGAGAVKQIGQATHSSDSSSSKVGHWSRRIRGDWPVQPPACKRLLVIPEATAEMTTELLICPCI